MTATDNSFAVSRLEAFPARPLASGEREVFEERFIAAVLKDSTGERWQECRQLPREAFGDYQRGKLWKEITGAESYDEAALTSGARKYFGHTTCGESYVDDKTAMYCGWIQLKGLGFAPKWLAALPISPAASAASEMKWGDLLAFDRSNDLDCLMGNRYLGRTGGLVLVGPSGVGKSVAALQLAACAALGRPFLGLQMHYRMRILYIQAEDDLGDVGEAVQGFVQGYTLTTEALVELKTNLRIVRWNDCAGQKFLGRLRAELAKHPADLVIINPLFSFCGCAVSEQKEMSAFLRNGLNPILNETRAACGIVHHTNKPNTDPKKGRKRCRRRSILPWLRFRRADQLGAMLHHAAEREGIGRQGLQTDFRQTREACGHRGQ